MNLLGILPLSRRRLDVLFEIYADGQNYLRNISRQLGMNPSLAFSILKKLHHSHLVVKERIGKEVQYSLDKGRDYEILVRLLEEYHLERAVSRSEVLKPMINLLINNEELMKTSHNIYLFGSYVLGDYTEGSDIDILFVNEDRGLAGKACREISAVIGKHLNPLIYAKEKFESDLSRQEPLLYSIVNNVRNRAIIK